VRGRLHPEGPVSVAGALAARPAVSVRAATLRAIYMIWRRDLIRFWRDRTRVLGALVQPLLFLVLLGTGLSSALRGAGGFRPGLAPFVGVKLTPLAVVELLGLIFCVAVALSSVGVALAARMHSMMGFQFVLNFLVQPCFFLSGAMFPVTGLPVWMTALTRIDPLSYGVDPIRRVVLGASGVP